VLAGAIALVFLVSLFVTASRGAIGVGLGALLVLGAAWWPRARWPMALSATAVAVSLALGIVADAQVFRKHQANVQAGVMLSYRGQVWQVALDTWRAHPWFGVGLDNFERVTRSREDDPNRALYPHAHNLYLNALAERGALGAAPLAAVLVAWPAWLLRRRPRRADAEHDWLLWSAAAGAWIVTVVAGTVNTTLHQEHGLLAALLLGLWLSRQHRL
jgi:O-antigen ligase